MDYLIMIGQLMLSLCILIILHEMGHFLPARWFKTRAEKFYLFFDPWISLLKAKKLKDGWQVKTAFSKKQEFENDDEDVTEYGLGWLPLGGYVKIAGMVDESFDREQLAKPAQPWEFRSKPAWQRLIIMLGGVTVNFLLGFLLFGFVLWFWGEQYLPAENVKTGIYADSLGQEMGLRDGDKIVSINGKPFEKFSDKELVRAIIIDDAKNLTVDRNGEKVDLSIDPKFTSILASSQNKDKRIFGARMPIEVGDVTAGSPAEGAGLKKDDKILALNGTPTPYFHEFYNKIQTLKSTPVTVTVLRENRDTLQLAMTTTEKGTIGFAPFGLDKFFEVKRAEYGAGESVVMGFSKGWTFLSDQVKAFGRMFSGEINASESLGGFGTFAKLYGTVWDWERFWNMTAIVSLILAFMNLLPIPALDGGHVMFLLWEVFTGRKPSDKFLEYATTAGFVLVLSLVIYANGLDIWRGCS